MKIEIRNSPIKGRFDLLVNGKIELIAESMQVCDNVKFALENPGNSINDECSEVADNIRMRYNSSGDNEE